ncbi:alpha/beta fold hydrolase [Embleya sp. NPDC050493]|uniref:alpha/beta fold hydrolase n=1 Tax=Embleya sp. NPDC050493 TaxID=3363989 RepID=UPI0037BCA59F
MRRRKALAVLAAPALVGLGAGSARAQPAAERIAGALDGDLEVRGREHGPEWTRTRLEVRDGAVPLVVDVVADTRHLPRRLVYLLPGGGLDFSSNFFTPTAHNLAHHLRERGYLVIGISPRENDAAPADLTAAWGLAAHKRDAHKVIDAVDSALRVPYELLGHSAGAALALDLAADRPARLRRVMVLDTTGPYEGDLAIRAARTRAALDRQLAAGTYANDPGLKGLLARAVGDPDGVSAVPRPVDPNTRFTNAALAHFALIHTSSLPGPTNWVYEQGFAAGSFAFGATPAEDRFGLAHGPLSVWAEATARFGGGLIPTALLRDLTAIWAGEESVYRIDWSAIDAEVTWVNTALGRGDHPLGADLIRAGGNPKVSFTVVPDYGHGDATWSATADADVWRHLV